MITRKTPRLVEALLSGVGSGHTLRQTCRAQNVSYTTVYNWLRTDDALAQRMARARMLGFDAIAEEILDIIDDSGEDWSCVIAFPDITSYIACNIWRPYGRHRAEPRIEELS